MEREQHSRNCQRTDALTLYFRGHASAPHRYRRGLNDPVRSTCRSASVHLRAMFVFCVPSSCPHKNEIRISHTTLQALSRLTSSPLGIFSVHLTPRRYGNVLSARFLGRPCMWWVVGVDPLAEWPCTKMKSFFHKRLESGLP